MQKEALGSVARLALEPPEATGRKLDTCLAAKKKRKTDLLLRLKMTLAGFRRQRSAAMTFCAALIACLSELRTVLAVACAERHDGALRQGARPS